MHKTEIQFPIARLQFASGVYVQFPLHDTNSVSIGEQTAHFVQRYQKAFQNTVLNQGNIISLAEIAGGTAYEQGEIHLHFPASKGKKKHVAFSLYFEYFYQEVENGFWGIVPAVGVDAFGESHDELEALLQEAVQIEFKMKKRLANAQQIVTAMWYEAVSLQQEKLRLKVPDPEMLRSGFEDNSDPLLPKAASLITENVHSSKKSHFFGMEEMLTRVCSAIQSDFNPNVLVVGVSGAGKTAMVYAAAKKLPKIRMWESSAAKLIKELMRDTVWQDNLPQLSKELSATKDFLFIQNLMELFEVGHYEGNDESMAEYMRTFIEKGEMRVITECTPEQFARIERMHPGYIHLFQVIRIQEPEEERLHAIVSQAVHAEAKSLNIVVHDNAIEEVLRLTRRFDPYSGFPGRPIRFLYNLLLNMHDEGTKQLSGKTAIARFAEESGMPTFMIDNAMPLHAGKVRAYFFKHIFGQDRAIDAVTDVLMTVKAALSRAGRPIASFLMVGPTGVGKTEVAKVLASFMFGGRNRMQRFDMSEYADPTAVIRLLGSKYTGEGLLTSAVRRNPFCVLLFDEIEKADASFYDLLLQILGEGRLTDHRGHVVNFCSTIILMTSNIGAADLKYHRIHVGNAEDTREMEERLIRAVQNYFRPELINRMDRIIVFKSLSQETVRFIIEREIEQLLEREGIHYRNVHPFIDEAVYDYVAQEGYSAEYGARYLQRSIRNLLTIPLAKTLNNYDIDEKLNVHVRVEAEKIHISCKNEDTSFDYYMDKYKQQSLAKTASEYRRQATAIARGNYFMRLESDCKRYEMERKKNTQIRNLSLSPQEYAAVLELKHRTQNTLQQAEEIELNLALASSNFDGFKSVSEEHVNDWQQRFLQIAIDLYSHYNPDVNICVLSLYGKDLQQVVDFYVQLANKKEWQCNTYEIWHLQGVFEKVAVNTQSGEITPSEKQRRFVENGQIAGVEMRIHGKGAFLYLESEAGIQSWKTRAYPNEKKYVVSIHKQAHEISTEVLQKNFFRKAPRRIVSATAFLDKEYKVKKEQAENQHLELLIKTLDERFKNYVIYATR